MDQDRQIRFAIPPFFLFFSLLIGVFLSNNPFRAWLVAAAGPNLLAVGAAVAASALPIGFFISAVTLLMLRFCFLPTGRSFETAVSADTLKVIWPFLKTTLECDQRLTFQATVTFDHEIISPGVHSWIVRRWNAFLISVQACVALALAHGVAWMLSLEQPCRWYIGSLCVGVILAVNAYVTWKGTMEMLEFQARRLHVDKDSTGNAAANP